MVANLSFAVFSVSIIPPCSEDAVTDASPLFMKGDEARGQTGDTLDDQCNEMPVQ